MAPPPAWLIIGLLICFMETLWMGMVLDLYHGHYHDDSCSTRTNNLETPTASNSSSSLSTHATLVWKRQTFSCVTTNDLQQVVFVGLDHAESTIVGNIAVNLERRCRDAGGSKTTATNTTTSHHYVDIHFVFFPHPTVQQQEVLQRLPHPMAVAWGDIHDNPTTTRWVTFLREPNDRAIAEFFRWISIFQLDPTNQRLNDFLSNGPHLEHYYLRHLLLRGPLGYKEPLPVNETKLHRQRMALRSETMNRYAFIGITERMMESMVVLKMLWNLSWRDLLHLSPYPSFFLGYYQYSGNLSCIYQTPFFTNYERSSILENRNRTRRISEDVILYDVANARLDATMEMLGYDEVQSQIQTLHRLLQTAIDQCWESTTFPCSASGDLALHNHSCLLNNELGCGNDCLQKLTIP